MEFTKLPSDAFTHLQLNAGIICSGFTPATGAVTGLMGATTGGFAFNSNPSYTDFGEDVDNCPPNTKQLKRISYYDPSASGTFLTLTADSAKTLIGAASVDANDATHVIPANQLKASDFQDVWIVGDYSDKNTGANAGYLAIHLKDALNTAGFQLQTGKDSKGQFAFDFHAHYDLSNIDAVPFEIYVKEGVAPDTTLSALTIASLTLSPTFSASTTSYTTSTTDASNAITATATDSTNATVVIKNGSTTVTSGNSATWAAGENTVTITVTNSGESKVYTVVVTKGSGT